MGHWCPEALKLTHESYANAREHPQSHHRLRGGCAHLQSRAGLKAVGWWWGRLCFPRERSRACLNVKHLWLFRDACWGLATSWVWCCRARTMEVVPQPPRAHGPWGDGLGMKLVLQYPREIVSMESWKGISGWFVQDGYCQTHNGASQIWSHFPPHRFHLLLFFKHWFIFPLYLEISLVFVI